MLNSKSTTLRLFIARFLLTLMVFTPLSFYDVIIGRIKLTEILGPTLMALFASFCFSLAWLITYAIARLVLRWRGFSGERLFNSALILSELVSLYIFIAAAFLFYYYIVENPGNGVSFGITEGPLLQNGKLTELGVRDAIDNIAGVILVSIVIQFLNAIFWLLKLKLGNKVSDGNQQLDI
jgi:hypothetical protein